MSSNPIDQEKLRQAREWASDPRNQGDHHTVAAAELIESLPETIVDGDKVMKQAGQLRDLENAFSRVNPKNVDTLWVQAMASAIGAHAELLEALLPAPAPRAEIKLGGWAMHPEHGKVLISSDRADSAGDVRVHVKDPRPAVGTAPVWVAAADLSPVPPATPTEQAAPTPGTSPGGILHHPSSEVSADPNPGEAWLVDHKYPNMIRTEYGWRGQHGYYLDDYNNITPLHRLAPVVEPRVLRTVEDYENAPNGTVVHQGISGITHRKNCWVWKLYGVESVDSEDMAGTPRAVIWEPGDGA